MGSGDSHSDSRIDRRIDGTGNNLVYGNGTVLELTQSYIDIVSQLSGINPTEAIRYEDKSTMVSLVDAMIRVECGQPVERRIIIKAYDLA